MAAAAGVVHGGARAPGSLVNLVKSLQYLDLSLLECFLLGLELSLELLYGIVFARFEVPTTVDVAKTATADELFDLVFVPENHLAIGRWRHGLGLVVSHFVWERRIGHAARHDQLLRALALRQLPHRCLLLMMPSLHSSFFRIII